MSQGQTGLPLCKIRRKPGFVPGTNPLCPGDKPGLSRGHSRGVPRATGPKGLCLCAFFLPEKDATHKQIWPPPVPGTIPESCLCLLGFFSSFLRTLPPSKTCCETLSTFSEPSRQQFSEPSKSLDEAKNLAQDFIISEQTGSGHIPKISWYSAKRAGVKQACPNKAMAHICFMHDAHLGHACLFPEWPPAVETSIAVEDAVENRGLYRVFVSRLF